jgi:shikimate kinase
VKRHILLIGLPGVGKTTVGRMLAEKLGAPFVDTDAVIVRRMQKPVAQVFAEDGEPRFRQLEAEAVARALEGPPTIIAPGGGWAAQPGALESARGNGFLIYLKVMATTAAKRAGGEGTRPLLVGEDPVERMRDLLQAREPFYAQADFEARVDAKTPAQVLEMLLEVARDQAGWGS